MHHISRIRVIRQIHKYSNSLSNPCTEEVRPCLFSFVVAKSLVLRSPKEVCSALSWISHKKSFSVFLCVLKIALWLSWLAFLWEKQSWRWEACRNDLEELCLTRNFVVKQQPPARLFGFVVNATKSKGDDYKPIRRKVLMIAALLRIQFLT